MSPDHPLEAEELYSGQLYQKKKQIKILFSKMLSNFVLTETPKYRLRTKIEPEIVHRSLFSPFYLYV